MNNDAEIAGFISYIFNRRTFSLYQQVYNTEYSNMSHKMTDLNLYNTAIINTAIENDEIIQLLNDIKNFITNPVGELNLVEKYDRIFTILTSTSDIPIPIRWVQRAIDIMNEITIIYNYNRSNMRRLTSVIEKAMQSETANQVSRFIKSTKSLRRMGGENNKVNFIINNKNYIRKVYIEGNKQYIIMQKNKVYINKNNTIKIGGIIYNFQ